MVITTIIALQSFCASGPWSGYSDDAHLSVFAHDVVESRQETETRGDLGVHSSVHVVEEVESFTDQLVAFTQQTLLDLALTARKEVIRVRRLQIHNTSL